MAPAPTLIAVLARAPRPHRCKTRLIPRLGGRGAARVQRRLLEQAVAVACRAGPVELWCTPTTREASFLRLRRDHGVRLRTQPRGDLGRRMRVIANRVLARHPLVVLTGSDALDLSVADLREAAQSAADFLLQPSTDGGYVLLAARHRLPPLLRVSWSSGRELEQTARRLARAGRLQRMASRRDLDGPRDWRAAVRAGLLPALPGARLR